MAFIDEILTNLKEFTCRLTGDLYLPEKLKETNETKVLHISDTPDSIYPFILKVIDTLEPEVIIHTGDIVDNVKLGLGATERRYQEKLKPFLVKLQKRAWAETYLIPGNHDSIDILQELTTRIEIMPEGSIVEVDGIKIGVAHLFERLPQQVGVNLYGHNFVTLPDKDGIFLNGVLNINIILIPSLEIYSISYPIKTCSGRKYRSLKLP